MLMKALPRFLMTYKAEELQKDKLIDIRRNFLAIRTN